MLIQKGSAKHILPITGSRLYCLFRKKLLCRNITRLKTVYQILPLTTTTPVICFHWIVTSVLIGTALISIRILTMTLCDRVLLHSSILLLLLLIPIRFYRKLRCQRLTTVHFDTLKLRRRRNRIHLFSSLTIQR